MVCFLFCFFWFSSSVSLFLPSCRLLEHILEFYFDLFSVFFNISLYSFCSYFSITTSYVIYNSLLVPTSCHSEWNMKTLLTLWFGEEGVKLLAIWQSLSSSLPFLLLNIIVLYISWCYNFCFNHQTWFIKVSRTVSRVYPFLFFPLFLLPSWCSDSSFNQLTFV